MTVAPAGRAGFFDGLVASAPIAIGYFPIAFSFGVAAMRAGFSGPEALLLSVVMYAGASQFVTLALVSGGASIAVTIATLLAMNVRHVLYGPALLDKAGSQARTSKAWAWAFWLTDEVFAAALGFLSRRPGAFSQAFMFGIGLGAYGAWVGGTAVGAALGGGALEAYPSVEAALGFMLPALFLSLLLSIASRRELPVIATAGLVCGAVTLLASPALGLVSGMVAGALAGVLRKRGPAPGEKA